MCDRNHVLIEEMMVCAVGYELLKMEDDRGLTSLSVPRVDDCHGCNV